MSDTYFVCNFFFFKAFFLVKVSSLDNKIVSRLTALINPKKQQNPREIWKFRFCEFCAILAIFQRNILVFTIFGSDYQTCYLFFSSWCNFSFNGGDTVLHAQTDRGSQCLKIIHFERENSNIFKNNQLKYLEYYFWRENSNETFLQWFSNTV